VDLTGLMPDQSASDFCVWDPLVKRACRPKGFEPRAADEDKRLLERSY
jgi:hypothetical protein